MSAVAEVRLWGRTIGAVALDDGVETVTFQYDLITNMPITGWLLMPGSR